MVLLAKAMGLQVAPKMGSHNQPTVPSQAVGNNVVFGTGAFGGPMMSSMSVSAPPQGMPTYTPNFAQAVSGGGGAVNPFSQPQQGGQQNSLPGFMFH